VVVEFSATVHDSRRTFNANTVKRSRNVFTSSATQTAW